MVILYMIFLLPLTIGAYHKVEYGQHCSDSSTRITDRATCQAAAATLGLDWGNGWWGPNDFPGCLHTRDKRNKVYFNYSPHASNNPSSHSKMADYAEICTGEGSTFRCPEDFIEDIGDVPGGGIRGGFSEKSIRECGQACEQESSCNSFNYSPTKQWCVIYQEKQPTADKFEDYEFCKKKQGCPDGYTAQDGDIPEMGSLEGNFQDKSRDECAKLCTEKDECLSFEYSHTSKICNLNKETNPTLPRYKDYQFCSKSAPAVGGCSMCVPLGTILSWVNKPVENARVVPLPSGWHPCDGTNIPQPSIWAGLKTPNLNGEKRFLRGGSNTDMLNMEEDTAKLEDHTHIDGGHTHSATSSADPHTHGYYDKYLKVERHGICSGSYWNFKYDEEWKTTGPAGVYVTTTVDRAYSNMGKVNNIGGLPHETKPKNMNVIFIMKVY